MTASLDLTVQQRRIVDALRRFLGDAADALYEANGRSLRKLAFFARDSSLPCCQQLVTGLALAQELLVEELSAGSVFDSPSAVADFLKLHFAGQPYESSRSCTSTRGMRSWQIQSQERRPLQLARKKSGRMISRSRTKVRSRAEARCAPQEMKATRSRQPRNGDSLVCAPKR